MRFHISIHCLILAGIFMQHGDASGQISSLPPLKPADVPAAIAEQEAAPVFRSVPVIKPINDASSVPTTDSTETETNLSQFADVFEGALSRFPQHRTAKLPLKKQQPANNIESSRFQDLPTITAAEPVKQSLLEQRQGSTSSASQIGQVDNGEGIRPVSSRKPVQDFVDPNGFAAPQMLELGSNVGAYAPLSTTQNFPQGQWQAPETMAVPNESGDFQTAPMLPLETAASPAAQLAVPVSIKPTTPRQAHSIAMPANAYADDLTWWKSVVTQSIDGRPSEPVDSNGLVYRALQNSPRIMAVSQNPLIRELQIVEADAEFDAVRFLRSQFEDRVDPVGNQLTVGNGESFLKDNIWSANAGFRKKARNGANWELNQRLGFQNSNSNFFVPQDQGTATLALNVTQPLLRGRGRYYNQSQILIAQATNGAAWKTFHAELQDELLGVVSAYWDLYLTRSIYLQKRRNVERGEKILYRLEGRKELDSLPSQIARARSSVQTRQTELANALRDVRNAETEVRRRIADTSWMQNGGMELIPGELPSAVTFQVPLEQVVYSALQNRPEVSEAMDRVRIASIQRDVSSNELLPELSLLMGTYVSALRGDTGIENAFQDQFGQVKPGYSVGINFELPVGNRAARSRFAQRQLQVRKIRAEVDEVMQNVIAESQVALRRVESASETLVAATEAIRAARLDREQFQRRWESFALVEGDLADGQNPTTVLDQLLNAQDRLASAELVYVQAERELKVSEVSLQRSMGTLLMTQNVSTTRGFENDTPRVDLIKGGPASSGATGIPTMAAPMGAAPAAYGGQAPAAYGGQAPTPYGDVIFQ